MSPKTTPSAASDNTATGVTLGLRSVEGVNLRPGRVVTIEPCGRILRSHSLGTDPEVDIECAFASGIDCGGEKRRAPTVPWTSPAIPRPKRGPASGRSLGRAARRLG